MSHRLAAPRLVSTTLALVLGMLLFGACNSKGWKRIDKDELRPLLMKMTLLSSVAQQEYMQDSVRQAEYAALLAAEGYTVTDWDSTIAWYARYDMTLLNDFYRVAYDSLEAMRSRLQVRYDSVSAAEAYRDRLSAFDVDSVDFLRELPRLYVQDGSYLYRRFDITPQTPYDSTHYLIFTTRILGLAELADSIAPLRMYVCTHLSDSTTRVDSIDIRRSGLYRLEASAPDGHRITRCSGFVKGVLPLLAKDKKRFIALDSFSLVRMPRVFETPPESIESASESISDTEII